MDVMYVQLLASHEEWLIAFGVSMKIKYIKYTNSKFFNTST